MEKFKYTTVKPPNPIICDSNVWYYLANGTFTKPNDATLIPTSFIIMELASSPTGAIDPKLFQDVIRSIHTYGKSIIPTNPFDYILTRHDPSYKPNIENIEQVLLQFSEILKLDIQDNGKLDEETKQNILDQSELDRSPMKEFANFGTENLMQIRENIKTGKGRKEHLKTDSTNINQEMFKSVLNQYLKDINSKYVIDFKDFKWSDIELFMTVTEIYFKKLETTPNMKIKPNDSIDWLNMLYVAPSDKYLTFDLRWRNYILEDERIKHYLFQNQ